MTKVEFNSKTHQYFIDDELYPSVTQILSILNKPALIYWASNITADYILNHLEEIKNCEINPNKTFTAAKREHQSLKEKAADIGTQTHRLIEKYLKGQSYEDLLNENTFKQFNAFKKWLENKNFKLIESERIVYSKKYKVAGTADIIAWLNEKAYLIDLKTSNSVYKEMILQIAAYKFMWQEVTLTTLDGIGILRLDKVTGEPEWKEYTNKEYQKHIKAFKLLTKYYHAMNEK